MASVEPDSVKRTTRFFFIAYVSACFLFWWLPSILFRIFGQEDPVHTWAWWTSILGLSAFAVGYSISFARVRTFVGPIVPNMRVTGHLMDSCEPLAFQATLLLAPVALLLSINFFLHTMGIQYGDEDIPFAYQIVLYTHLFLGFLFLGVAKTVVQNKSRIVTASILIILPRLIVSLHLRRFFLAQALLPILFIGLARGWLNFSGKRVLLALMIGLFVVVVPALTRGDSLIGQDALTFFESGGVAPLLLQDFKDTNLSGRCPPLLVALTAKTVPYDLLGLCMTTSPHGMVPASTAGIIGEDDPTGTVGGAGGNYLLELYLTGGFGAIALGSAVFGLSCRTFIAWIGQRSAFAGIWAECLSRALLAPRGFLGYVYERIPSLVLATFAMLLLSYLAKEGLSEMQHLHHANGPSVVD